MADRLFPTNTQFVKQIETYRVELYSWHCCLFRMQSSAKIKRRLVMMTFLQLEGVPVNGTFTLFQWNIRGIVLLTMKIVRKI